MGVSREESGTNSKSDPLRNVFFIEGFLNVDRKRMHEMGRDPEKEFFTITGGRRKVQRSIVLDMSDAQDGLVSRRR